MDTGLNIVVVEDHDMLREVTVEALQSSGHWVVGIESAEALAEISSRPIDLMVIDLNLPGEDGISLAQRIRMTQPQIGIIMLTARNRPSDKTIGYHSGADIYLTKPTSPEELNAAVSALMRRLHNTVGHLPSLKLDINTHTLDGLGKKVTMSAKEVALLSAFARAHEHRLENWQLIELLGKSPESYRKANLEVQIVRLRKKLALASGSENNICAIRGVGYQLSARLEIL